MLFKKQPMKKMILVSVLLSSCASFKKTDPYQIKHYFVISSNGVEKQFDNQANVDISRFQIAGTEIYVSNFSSINDDQMLRTIDRKKKSFLNFFQNDITPYTGIEKNRTQCLMSERQNSVEFFSGVDNQWAECAPLLPKKVPAIRIWKSCYQTLWQITIKTANPRDFVLKCQ